jgi:adenylate cyclase
MGGEPVEVFQRKLLWTRRNPSLPKIDILPDGKEIETRDGETILQAALRAEIPLAHICSGNARCSTCRVIILEGMPNTLPPNAAEKKIADLSTFDPSVRLACQTIATGNIKIRRLVMDDEDLELSSLFIQGVKPGATGIEKNVLILFLDIQGFTAFSEALLPYDVIHILNRFFNQMGEVINKYKGEINNYMGDGFMALFETQDPREGALRAIGAGLEMLARVRGLQSYLEKLYYKSFQIRIGLHYGHVVAGTVGASGSRKMTVIGDSVNFASRIEAANKKAGTRFLISEETFALVKDRVEVGKQVYLALPGKTGKYRLYEVKKMKPEAS